MGLFSKFVKSALFALTSLTVCASPSLALDTHVLFNPILCDNPPGQAAVDGTFIDIIRFNALRTLRFGKVTGFNDCVRVGGLISGLSVLNANRLRPVFQFDANDLFFGEPFVSVVFSPPGGGLFQSFSAPFLDPTWPAFIGPNGFTECLFFGDDMARVFGIPLGSRIFQIAIYQDDAGAAFLVNNVRVLGELINPTAAVDRFHRSVVIPNCINQPTTADLNCNP